MSVPVKVRLMMWLAEEARQCKLAQVGGRRDAELSRYPPIGLKIGVCPVQLCCVSCCLETEVGETISELPRTTTTTFLPSTRPHKSRNHLRDTNNPSSARTDPT